MATISTTTGPGVVLNSANNTSSVTTTVANQLPVANTVTNRLQTPEGNTAGSLLLSALTAVDADGTVATFTIASLPDAAAGVLQLNGSPVAVGQSISLAEAPTLRFDPVSSFVGNTFFTFTATDNRGGVSAPALFTIPVGQDNASQFVSTSLKGGANQYQNGDVIANASDANSAVYNSLAAVTDNGLRDVALVAGTLPEGVELDPVTGQLRVFDRSRLVAGSYPVTLRTVDANGGVTQQVVPLQIGSAPLPVELTRFTATAAGQNAELRWATASELNNTGFQVERSLDGTRFDVLDFVAGASTSSQARTYAFVDAGAARLAPGQPLYYRLQQVDTNGRRTASPVRALTFAPGNAEGLLRLALYPNPAATATTLDLTGAPAGAYHVTLVDIAGRTVQTLTLTGGISHRLDLVSLPSGTYLVRIDNGNVQATKRLLKQ